MRLVPFSRLTLFTEDPPDVAVAKLSNLVCSRWFSLQLLPHPFRGVIRGRHFKVVRVLLWARNSWQPVVVGEIVQAPGGTEVRVKMRLNAVVATVTALWFGGLLFGGARILWSGLTEGFGPGVRDGRQVAGAGVGLLAIGVMVLAGYLLTSFAFWAEVKRTKAALCEGLGCRELKPGHRPLGA